MSRATPDVLILGSGPAGSAAGSLLARWGHRVVLVTKPSSSAAVLGESIPPSTQKLLDVIGVRDRVEQAGFVRSTGNTVWWGADGPRVEFFANGAQGWQVTRGALETVLIDHARDAGVAITHEHVTRESVPHHAPFTLDCTGRAGVLARASGVREYDDRFRTIALVGLWRSDAAFDLPELSHTVIESYDGGWAWSVPRSGHERCVAVMVDPRTSELSRDAPSLEVYRRELAKTSQMRRMVAAAALLDGPSGWDASMYHAKRYVDGNVLFVGDAASFIDPLSSAGIKKALASGWLAAVTVHTSLTRPAMRRTALAFFAAREAEVYASFLAMTERFFAAAATGHAHPFWTDRTDEPRPTAERERLEAAFARLRAAPKLTVTPHPTLRYEPRPAVSGTEIIMEQRIVLNDADAGWRYAFDVDLIGLTELAPAYNSVPDAFAAYNRRYAPVALPDFLAALATALARNWLVWM